MNGSITWPLAFNIIRRQSVSNTFGWVRTRADGTPRPHQGWDFSAPVGTPAHAIADGTVAFVRDGGDYGLQVCLAFDMNGKARYAFYAHLEKVFVSTGAAVKRNDLICKTGQSGNAYGMPLADQHLHFEIREIASPGLGLKDRRSPVEVFEKCPLQHGITG